MAAIYSGIYLKLKSSKTSWEDKLKLARFAWVSHQCVLPNKEQVLLDWVSRTLVSNYNKKYELEDEVVEKLWAYLDNVIHSKKLQDLLKTGRTVGLSFAIAQVINKRLSEAYSEKTQQNISTLLSCSSGILSTPSLSILYTAKCPAITTQVIRSMEMELTEVLVKVLGNCSAEEFYAIMRLVLQGLEVKNVWQQKAKEVLSAVMLTKLLLSCPLSGDKEKAFWFASPQIITALALQTKEACQDQSLISIIVIPILETVAALLRQGEGVLVNPHHVSLAFSILLTVPLDHLKTEDYHGVFLGIHEVLFSIVQCHPKVLLKAAPSFLCSFHRLVVSVMHEGRQKGDRGNMEEFEMILKCAHLVERMYTHIAAEMENFTVFSAFMVAQYVTELQKVTLHPAVKAHLTEGIYHIFDLCIERDIKFLNASLPAGVREVFKDLYNDYNHYHKAKKHGEKKYTA
ncbi:PREDICTED: unhealthy ribosome biogenesis protein 2 homolog isoform X2 [Sturnus vulgaris]|uniref:unhealthy ribosome biogenesis protein 2 homolog isoform X2 n=1 Tax=Sturnus vulgaris TaxID=9172 RepID=UPI00071A0AAF|nr:PREDICTED: unhealthy ribosome biogenesis protein 2 homolog isoform X2 [Sturnus vulgaris]